MYVGYVICQYFLSICGLSFNFPNTIFERANVLQFWWSPFNIIFFSFMDYAFGVTSKKSFPTPRSPRFFLMFSSRYFIVGCFTVRTMSLFWISEFKIHYLLSREMNFEWMFVFSVRSGSKYFFLLAYECLIVLAPFVEMTIFFPLHCFWQLCQKPTDIICVGLFLDLLFYFIDLFVYLYTNTLLSSLM